MTANSWRRQPEKHIPGKEEESQGEDGRPTTLPLHTASDSGLEMRPACPFFAFFAKIAGFQTDLTIFLFLEVIFQHREVIFQHREVIFQHREVVSQHREVVSQDSFIVFHDSFSRSKIGVLGERGVEIESNLASSPDVFAFQGRKREKLVKGIIPHFLVSTPILGLVGFDAFANVRA